MRRRLFVVSALVLAVSFTVAGAFGPSPTGPHDALVEGLEKPDPEAYWLPRHRAALLEDPLLFPRRASATDAAGAPLRFRNKRRVSTDLLEPPSAVLPTAQAEAQTEPYVAVNPENPLHLVAGWQEDRFSDGGARALGVAVSLDGGRRWTDALVPGLTIASGGTWSRASDPWPAFGPGGVVYFNSLLFEPGLPNDNAIAVSISEDGGFTWGPPVEVVRDPLDFHDKNSMVVDTVSTGPHRGNAYVAWDINLFRGGRYVAQRLVVARSTDGGRSWSRPRRVAQGPTNIGVVLRVGSDGTVYAVWAAALPGAPTLSLRFASSTNGGRRFSSPRKIADMLPIGVEGWRSGAILPSLAIDPLTQDLYVAWADARFTGTDQATVVVSRDGGASWTAPMRVSRGPDASPAMTVSVTTNGAGEALVGYYTIRNVVGRPTFADYFVTRSRNRGESFGPRVRVSRPSFDAGQAARAAQGAFFLGDYVGLTGTDDGFVAVFTAAFAPSRLGPGRQADVFAVVSR